MGCFVANHYTARAFCVLKISIWGLGSKAKFDSWIDNRILPCWDLLIFGKHYGIRLTDATIARIIYPDLFDVGIEEKTRKTRYELKKFISGNELDRINSAATVYLGQNEPVNNFV